MAGEPSNDLRAEQELVAGMLGDAFADLPEGLSQFVRSEMAERQILAGIVLASATPVHDSAEAASRRVALAAALELLQIALNIHRLLLTPVQVDTIDSALLGGTILAGDYCFSRAAVLAARTCHPQVVSVFAELLKEVSQANLRRVIAEEETGQDANAFDEREALFHRGALAGAVLAGLAAEERALVARYASRLGRGWLPGSAESFNGGADATAGLPPHQRERWGALVNANE